MKNYYHWTLALVMGCCLTACDPVEKVNQSDAPLPETPAVEAPATPEPASEVSAVEEMPASEAPVEANPVEAAPAAEAPAVETEWVPLFNGENLDGWTPRGAATWEVVDGVITGHSPGGQGHLYAAPELTDLEVKGMFRITDEGSGANSGLYFRANPPEDNPDGYPNGYEAQICHNQDAHTGWLWKPGSPTGKAEKLLTKDGEWFSMRVKMVGKTIQIWVQDELVMTYEDEDYDKGFFALQCHNDGMMAEAKDLYYRDLSAQ